MSILPEIEWEDIKRETIEIGKFEGFEIRYNSHRKEFLSFVKGEILTAKSQLALERRIKAILQVKFDKVIIVREWDISLPIVVQAVKRGHRLYAVQEGKLKPIDGYYAYEYKEKVLEKLNNLVKQHSKIEGRWQELINRLRRVEQT